jgi:hypothetical protein
MEKNKLKKTELNRDMSNLATEHYQKYFFGMCPDEEKNRYYYGMNNGNYYQHNMVNVNVGDANDGVYREGEFYSA